MTSLAKPVSSDQAAPRQAAGKSWSLTRRCAVLLCLLSVLPATIATTIGGRLLSSSIERELDALAREEIEEARAATLGVDDAVESFTEISPHLASQHPSVGIAWRLVDAAGAVHSYGQTRIFDEFEFGAAAPEELLDLGSGRRVIRADLGGSASITLALDGSKHCAVVRRYWLIALITIGISLVLGLGLARVFAGRLESLLRGITAGLRQPGEPGVAMAGVPVELQPISAELRIMLEDVNERARETQCFVAGLAHELRSPIQNLIGQAEVALLQPRTAEAYRELLASQLEEQHEFATAIDNLILLCAVEEPARVMRHETFDLAEEVEMRLQHERRCAAAGDVTLTVVSRGSLELRGDRESILRAVKNVVGNAVKWSPPGTEVAILLDGTGKDIAVDVDDAGPGIPEAERESVFVPFVRGSEPSGERTGFGLGLAITRTAVEQHGGTASVLGAPAGGARVRIAIPRGEVPVH